MVAQVTSSIPSESAYLYPPRLHASCLHVGLHFQDLLDPAESRNDNPCRSTASCFCTLSLRQRRNIILATTCGNSSFVFFQYCSIAVLPANLYCLKLFCCKFVLALALHQGCQKCRSLTLSSYAPMAGVESLRLQDVTCLDRLAQARDVWQLLASEKCEKCEKCESIKIISELCELCELCECEKESRKTLPFCQSRQCRQWLNELNELNPGVATGAPCPICVFAVPKPGLSAPARL